MSDRSGSASYPPTPAFATYPRDRSPPLTALEKLARSLDTKGKGKGKERAIDQYDPEVAEGISVDKHDLKFGIRFTAHDEEDLLELWVDEKDTVREVKRKIRYLRPSLTIDGRPRRLRLIQLGRLLTDGTLLVPYTVSLLARRDKLVQQETQGNGEALYQGALQGLEAIGVNSLLKPGRSSMEKDRLLFDLEKQEKALEDDRVWIHASVGEAMEDDEIEGERIQTDQITPLQGLDKMIEAGFSQEEIDSMRETLLANAGGTPIDSTDAEEHLRALEDQWMDSLTSTEAVTDTSTAGVYMTLLQGVTVGFFIPFLPFFFFRTQIFSKRMQMAIVLGAFINVLFGLLRAIA